MSVTLTKEIGWVFNFVHGICEHKNNRGQSIDIYYFKMLSSKYFRQICFLSSSMSQKRELRIGKRKEKDFKNQID